MLGDFRQRGWLKWLAGALAAFATAWWTEGKMRTAPPTHVAERWPAPALTEGRTTAELAQCLDALHSADDAFTRLERFVSLVEGCSPAELKRLAAQPSLTAREWELLVQRWAEVDPASLFSVLCDPLNNIAKGNRLHGLLFAIWFEKDPAAALAALDRVANQPLFAAAVSALLPAVFERDPEAAFALLRKARVNEHGDWFPAVPDTVWERDPAGFIARVAEEFRTGLRSPPALNAALRALTTLARTDPAGARRLFTTQREAFPRGEFDSELIEVLMRADAQAAAAWIASLPSAADRQQFGTTIAAKLAETDPAGAIAHAQANLTGQARNEAISLAARKLPLGEQRHLGETTPPGRLRSQILREAAYATGKAEGVDTALAWVLALPDHRAVSDGLSGLAGLADAPAAEAAIASYIHSDPDSASSVDLADEFIGAVSSDNMAGLLRRAFALPEEFAREPLASRLSAYDISDDGYRNLGHAAEALPPAQIDYLANLLVEDVGLSSSDSEADEGHLQRYTTLPPGALRDAFVRKVEAADFGSDSARKEKVLSQFR